uniref:Cordon-bleu WH2 repeat protein n=1 Tax=Gasterosteus aculeatus aculeatus TaxID=481459 RepID=A0AAQ4S5G4_GASAC
MVNYHGSQKAVVRVNPFVPLQALVPVICDKCEFEPAHVLLLKDGISHHELPLDRSLTELGIKELYVHNQSLVFQHKRASAPTLNYSDSISSSTNSLNRAEKKGLLGIFQFSRRKNRTDTTSMDTDECDDKVIQVTAPQSNMGLGSESQQRKRKAPAPPPTPASISPGADGTSTSAVSSPVSPATETPSPAFSQSNAASATAVKIAKPVNPPPVCSASPTPGSPTPSGSSGTTDSPAVQDSSSELSHSLDDSDPDQAASYCSSLTSSTASGSVRLQPAVKSSGRRAEAEASEKAKSSREATSASSSRSESETALNVKLDDVENNRHSAMAWLHSMHGSAASFQKPETETPEEETVSLGSGGSSLPDQGYAASEGMAEGEDSGIVSCPSETQPTSPDGSLSQGGRSAGGGRLSGPMRDNSSDSDEGCATWESRHRHNNISPQAKSGRLKGHYEDDPELTAQLHQTLADFEADLADHIDIASSKNTPYTLSTDSNEVPVSVVDMDVPVTAIDEVLEDFERHDTTSLTQIQPASRNGQSSVKTQNQNNNACTAADRNKSSSANNKQPSRPKQQRTPLEDKSKADKKEKKMPGTKMKEMITTDSSSVKEQRATSAVDPRKLSRDAEVKRDLVKGNAQSLQEKKSVVPPTSQRPFSPGATEETHSVHPNNSSPTGKITRNVPSRFGMKTFTVVPLKPAVVHAATGQPADKLTIGAIKIDDQGNMVKGAVSRNKVGGSSESSINSSEGSPLLGKAKAFWSSSERQENHLPRCSSTDGLKGPSPAISVATLKASNAEDQKITQNSFYKQAEKIQMVKEEAKEPVRAVKVTKEERVEAESKITVSKSVQEPSNKPALPPTVLPDPKKDLSFLKPSRQTSSQYVASAINKYTPKHHMRPSAKPSHVPNVQASSASLRLQTFDFQRSGPSIKVNPHQSSQSSLSDNDLASKSNPPDPKRSVSYPKYGSDSPRDLGEVRSDTGRFGSGTGSTKGSSNTLETETALNKHIQSGGPTQRNTFASNDSNGFKQIRLRSSSPAQSSTLHSSPKPPTVLQTVSQGLASNKKDVTSAAGHLTPDAETQPSVTVSEKAVTPGPLPPTLFGPVQKFRPVISRSVDKDTNLHSSLMEAIQTGGGRDRLKTITSTGLSSMKKASYVEEENERSALLAAIRAQSSSGRLRKTKSVVANELEEERGAIPPPPPPSFTGTVVPLPPPPPLPIIAPPPPPPVLPLAKSSTVGHRGATSPTDAALARDAMLEAIRSGSAAERLKKVPAPKKTLQVRGRLGRIQASSSTLPLQKQGRPT